MTMSQPMQVLTSHASVEWYTPSLYIELARQCMGSIDLDPASSEPANRQLVKAKDYHTDEGSNSGFASQWYGNVWLNPPYGKTNGKSNQEVWSQKLCAEYTNGHIAQAILLINSTHGYKWYEHLWKHYWCCCATERIRFLQYDPYHDTFYETDQAKRGQTFVYFGPHPQRFASAFTPIGRIVPPNDFIEEMLMEYLYT